MVAHILTHVVQLAGKPTRSLFLVLCAVLAISAPPAASASERTWTDDTGRHQIEAAYIGFSEGKVRLKKTDGSMVEVPLERLSDRDRAYVTRQRSGDRESDAAAGATGDLQKQLSLSFVEPFAVFPPKDAQPLFATIELTGTAAAEALHYGFLEVSQAETSGGEELQQIESSFSMDNPADQFVEVDRQRMFAGQFKKPEDKLRIHLMLQRPAPDAERLQVLEGTLQLMTGGERKQLTVGGIAQKAGQTLADPLLKRAELEIQVVDPAQAEVALPDAKPERMVSLIIRGPETAILDMGLVDGQGDELETTAAWSVGGEGAPMSYTLQAEQALPRNVGFHLSLAVDQERVRVPFRFENVPLPEGEGSTTADAVSGSGKMRSAVPRDRRQDASPATASAEPRALLRLRGHLQGVCSVAFSPDGKHLASAGEGGNVKIWDLETAKVRATCTGHEGPVRCVAFRADGRLLATTSNDQTVRLWDPRDGRQLKVIRGHWNSVLTADFSPDGSRLATGGRDWTVRLWDVETGRELGTLKGHVGWIHSVAFSPDGRWLASAAPRPDGRENGGEVILWDLNSAVPTQISYGNHKNVDIVSRKIQAKITGHEQGAESVAFLPDGSRLITGSRGDRTVRLWNVPSGEQVEQRNPAMSPLAVSPDGRLLAVCASSGEVQMRSAATGELLVAWNAHPDEVKSMAFSPRGTALATAGEDKVVSVWTVPSVSDRNGRDR